MDFNDGQLRMQALTFGRNPKTLSFGAQKIDLERHWRGSR
jgi:hypothetical protein